MLKQTKMMNKKGFTLVELIVVIAILAVLMMLIVPSISGYLDKSKTAVANANARSCYNAYMSAATMVESGLDSAADMTEFEAIAAELGADGNCTVTYSGTGVPTTTTITGAEWTDGAMTGTFSD